ncbi:lipoprotein 17-related variable surface protein [Mycoplasmopsis agassizii]|uniref:lipoprotein 17-related variable surface protein n=1 Tax=Mycoplasmopsis agassizii TaxID=33922 RepID=UPI003527CC93
MKRKVLIITAASTLVTIPVVAGIAAGIAINAQPKSEGTISPEARKSREAEIAVFNNQWVNAPEFTGTTNVPLQSGVVNSSSLLTLANFNITSKMPETDFSSQGWTITKDSFTAAGVNAVELTYTISRKFDTTEPVISGQFKQLITGFKVDDANAVQKIISEKPNLTWATVDGKAPTTKNAKEITVADFNLPKSQFGEIYSLAIAATTPNTVTVRVTVTSGNETGSYDYVATGVYNVIQAGVNNYFHNGSSYVPTLSWISSSPQKSILPSEIKNYTKAQLQSSFRLSSANLTNQFTLPTGELIQFNSEIDSYASDNNGSGTVTLKIVISPTAANPNQFDNVELFVPLIGFKTSLEVSQEQLTNFIALINWAQTNLAAQTPHGLFSNQFVNVDDNLIYGSNDVENFKRTFNSSQAFAELSFNKIAGLFSTYASQLPQDLLAFYNPQTAQGRENFAYIRNFGVELTSVQSDSTNPTSATITVVLIDKILANSQKSFTVAMRGFLSASDFKLVDSYNNAQEANANSLLSITYDSSIHGDKASLKPSELLTLINGSNTTVATKLESLKKVFAISQPASTNGVEFEFTTSTGDGTTGEIADANDTLGIFSLYLNIKLINGQKYSKVITFEENGFVSDALNTNRLIATAYNTRLQPSYVAVSAGQGSTATKENTLPSALTTNNFQFSQADLVAAGIDPSLSLSVVSITPDPDAAITGKVSGEVEVKSSTGVGTLRKYTFTSDGFKSTLTDNLIAIRNEISSLGSAELTEGSQFVLPSQLQTANFTISSPSAVIGSADNIEYKIETITKINDVQGLATLTVLATKGEGEARASHRFEMQKTGLFTMKALLNKKFTDNKVNFDLKNKKTYLPSELAALKAGNSLDVDANNFPLAFLNAVELIAGVREASLPNITFNLVRNGLSTVNESTPAITNISEAITDIDDIAGTLKVRMYLQLTTTTADNGQSSTIFSDPFTITVPKTSGLLSTSDLIATYLETKVEVGSIHLQNNSTTVANSTTPADMVNVTNLVVNPATAVVKSPFASTSKNISLTASEIVTVSNSNEELTVKITGESSGATSSREYTLTGFMNSNAALSAAISKKVVPNFTPSAGQTKQNSAVSTLTMAQFDFKNVTGLTETIVNGEPVYSDVNGVVHRVNGIATGDAARASGEVEVSVLLTKGTIQQTYSVKITGFQKG